MVAYQHGDYEALAILIACFDRPMRCVAHRYLCCSQDIDDAVQDAWLAFATTADRIHTPMAIGGWLCVTTARTALTIARRQARCRPSMGLDNGESLSMELDEPDLDNDAEAVRQAVGRLDENDRELVWMLFESDLSYAEITARTGRAIGGIGPTRSRVIAKLRRDPSIRPLVTARTS